MSYRDIIPTPSDYPPELIKDFWPFYLAEWMLAEDRERYLASLQNALISVKSYDVTYRVWNGTALRWVRDLGAPYETENGEIYLFGSLQDVTDLVALRESVVQQEARFRATIEQTPYGMLFLSPEGHILYANPPVRQWLGEEALQGQRLQHLVHPADAAQLEETFQSVLRSDVVTTECELRMRGSAEEWLPLRLSLSSAHDDTGALTFLIGSLQDLRELKLTQEALMQSAKLASLGEAAASIAHELKSPLAAIRMKAEILGQLTSLPTFKPEHLPQKLGEIVTIVDRSLSVLQQMRDFSRKESSATEADERQEVFTLSELMEGVMLIAGGTLRQAGIQVVQDFPKELPPLIGNRTKLEQVFVNLCNNARDAMEESEQRLLKLQAVQHGDMVRLQVTDTGCGMPPEVLANLFRAFFTTKARGKGTGLGTSIIKRIVEEHGGRITVESEVNVGTTFTLTLPGVPEEPQQRAPAPSAD
jgi:two-component system sporulation sensor kinase A